MKGYSPGGRSVETRFKPGSRPQTWVPVGTEVVDSYGYRKRKVRDDAPTGMTRNNWQFVHILLWEQHNGPVPDGHNVVFRDKDRSNVVIENLECISRADNARRNTIHRYPRELKNAIRLAAKLKRLVNEKQNRRPS